MYMPLSILKEFADVVDGFWRDNREESALQIHKLAEKELESDVPSRRWVSDRVKELKATARGLGPEPIASPWGKQWPKDAASVEAAFKEYGDQIAAVIVEPVAGNMGCIPPREGYLQGLRDLCDEQWQRAYPRELAAFPVTSVRPGKFFPAVNRIDNVYGDRNLFCACPPIEAYE